MLILRMSLGLIFMPSVVLNFNVVLDIVEGA
jgi:hypothetical protein